MNRIRGFTLIELLIALAISGVLAAAAIPQYLSYVQKSREKVADTNLQTLKLAEEAYYFDRNEYLGGTYDPGVPDKSFLTDLGWSPDKDGSEFVYNVKVWDCTGSGKNTCYTITVTGYDGKVTRTDTRS